MNIDDLLKWVDQQQTSMLEMTTRWASINSHTFNVRGVSAVLEDFAESSLELEGTAQFLSVSPAQRMDDHGRMQSYELAPLLHVAKRPESKRQITLMIHADTVYTPQDDFQTVYYDHTKEILTGPGVCDAKGGMAVLLTALKAFEQFEFYDRLGWQIIINTDEEIGSPGSAKLMTSLTRGHEVGLIFEPALPDGNLIGNRKGSGNFVIRAVGQKAHAGRDPDAGRNAINALAMAICDVQNLHQRRPGLTINFGVIHGGTEVNVVPDQAHVRFNIRTRSDHDGKFCLDFIQSQLEHIAERTGIVFDVQGDFHAMPKPFEGPTKRLGDMLIQCGRQLDLDLTFHDSGGVCDGNRLQALGLACIDTLGPCGHSLHSPGETLFVPTLVERAKLTALLLMALASTEWT